MKETLRRAMVGRTLRCLRSLRYDSYHLLKSFNQLEKLDSIDLLGMDLRITCWDLVRYRDG
jgi:hypothetical protein